MLCYRHPKAETNLRCGKCERPICVKCSVPGPAGMRCPECASMRSTHLYKISPVKLALATALGLITGTVGAMFLYFLGFFVFLLGPAYGAAVAEVVLRSSGQKRGPVIEAVGIGSIVVGALVAIGIRMAPAALVASRMGTPPSATGLLLSALGSVAWPLVGVGLAISTCFSRLRYF